MTTPTVTPARGPVSTTGPRVPGQMYYVTDDMFVICTGVDSKSVASIIHPMYGPAKVPCHALREVRYV